MATGVPNERPFRSVSGEPRYAVNLPEAESSRGAGVPIQRLGQDRNRAERGPVLPGGSPEGTHGLAEIGEWRVGSEFQWACVQSESAG